MLSRNFVKSLFLLFFVSCVTEASKLTVNRETSKPAYFDFSAQCSINGNVLAGQSCSATWTVPSGWRYTVVHRGNDDPVKCKSGSFTYDRMPGAVLNAGESLSIGIRNNYLILGWINSATCWSGYRVEAVMVDDIGFNSSMSVRQHYDSNYVGMHYRYIISPSAHGGGALWKSNISYPQSIPMSIFRPYIGSRESITLDVQDKIDLRPGETKRLFTVDNGNTGKGTVSIIKSGEVAPYIEVYKNGASVKGCDGTYNIGGEYCEVRAVASPGWYGIKNGVINIRLTIN